MHLLPETRQETGRNILPSLLSDLPLAKPHWKPESKGAQVIKSTGIQPLGYRQGERRVNKQNNLHIHTASFSKYPVSCLDTVNYCLLEIISSGDI